MKKQCFKCGETKELSKFYKHPGTADKRLNKCKECTKKDSIENRESKAEYYRDYDRKRGRKRDIKKTKPKSIRKKQIYKDVVYKTWKGSNDDYRKLHKWVENKLGKVKKCTRCSTTIGDSKRFHWANISGEYKKDISDWIRLCAQCHVRQDWKTRVHPFKKFYQEK